MLALDGMIVIPPEHMARFAAAGWSRDRFMAELSEELLVDGDELLAGSGGIEAGLPPDAAGRRIGKFRPGGLLVVHAGGPAGPFTAIMAGWVNGPRGSDPVTREIVP